MTRSLSVTAALMLGALLAAPARPTAQATQDVALRAAIETETVKGDVKGAIDQYKKIVAGAGANRALAAQALVRTAERYEKLGDLESADGPSQPRVLFDSEDVAWIAPFDWSPDGKRIAVQVRRQDHKTAQIGWGAVENGSLRLLVCDLTPVGGKGTSWFNPALRRGGAEETVASATIAP